MTRNWPVRPGVPTMGHVTTGGAWHPGSGTTCRKCNPPSPAQPVNKIPKKH